MSYKLAFFISFFLLELNPFLSQTSSTDPIYEAKVIGGPEQIEYVLQTQLTLPKILLSSDFNSEITAFFNIDSAGKAYNFNVEGGINNALRHEIKRIFRFLQFRQTLDLPGEPRPYFLKFQLSAEKYNHYLKQKMKNNIKKPLPADSSYMVFSRADRSPEYYKGGESGLAEYLLSEIEYPKVASERSIEGTVILEFIVETNGYLTGILIKKGVNGGCSEEAIRLMKQTRWIPAVLDNKFVRYRMTYPITFNLRNQEANKISNSTTGQ